MTFDKMRFALGFYLAACAILYSCSDAIAGLEHPGTWRAISDCERYVFVMLSPLPIEEDFRYPEDEEEIQTIRSTYRKSGLYLNGRSDTPLWAYDGPWLSNSVIIAPDGEHIIVEGNWTFDAYALRAVEFTRKGKTIRRYHDTDIIPQWMLKRVLNGFEPVSCVGTSFDALQMTYTIQTNQGEKIIFDIKSGRIIDVRSPFPFFYGGAVVAIGSVCFGLVWRLRKSAKPRAA